MGFFGSGVFLTDWIAPRDFAIQRGILRFRTSFVFGGRVVVLLVMLVDGDECVVSVERCAGVGPRDCGCLRFRKAERGAREAACFCDARRAQSSRLLLLDLAVAWASKGGQSNAELLLLPITAAYSVSVAHHCVPVRM